MVPLTFADPADYERIDEDDLISVLDLPPVPGETLTCRVTKADGSTFEFECNHTFSDEQVEFLQQVLVSGVDSEPSSNFLGRPLQISVYTAHPRDI